jgi:hypothetical protein
MSSLIEIRKLKHEKYVKDELMPEVHDYILQKKNNSRSHQNILSNYFQNKYFKKVDNLNDMEENLIPGFYKLRLLLTTNNLIKQEIPSITGHGAMIDFDSDIDGDLNNEYMKYAIQESLESFDDGINVLVDLRIYGPDPYQPLYFESLPYYFNFNQVNVIKKRWSIINPESDRGLQYTQDLEFMHDVAIDLLNL